MCFFLKNRKIAKSKMQGQAYLAIMTKLAFEALSPQLKCWLQFSELSLNSLPVIAQPYPSHLGLFPYVP